MNDCQKKPQWKSPNVQIWEEEVATDRHQSVADWVKDVNCCLGGLMENCREFRHDDPDFKAWYQSIRRAAGLAGEAMEALSGVCENPAVPSV